MKIIRSWIVVGVLFCVLYCIAGCGLVSKVKERSIAQNQQEGVTSKAFYSALPPAEGSLWTDTGELLFTDRRARRVGDTIIIDIIENTSSKIDANTKISKSSSVDAGISNLAGYITRLEEKDKYIKGANLIGTNYDSNTEGKGTSDRSGQITASIGARVTNVLPNGNIVIFGKREMKVNNELQYITVTGITRPEDIGSDNRVKSTYLADASIVYSGKGVIADKQKSGWLTRIVDNVWPF